MGGNDGDENFDFPPGDPENPRNWPEWRKWTIMASLLVVDLSVSWIASGFSPSSKNFAKQMQVSSEVATLGLSMYVIGLAIGPMLLAPLSEYFGRSPIYIGNWTVCVLLVMASALVKNLAGFLVIRIINGVFASITIANFGGTIADLWPRRQRGIPMSLFLWAATGGSSTGYFLMSFIAAYRPYQDVFWALMGITGGFGLIMAAALKESRHSTILRARYKKELKDLGDRATNEPKYDILKHRSASDLFRIALLRPFRFLLTEAIIIFGAAYNGYLYGLSFLFNGAFEIVFGSEGHGFGTIGVGLSFLGIIVGISLGPLTNLLQERYYQRRTEQGKHNIPEARVQIGMVAALTFPVSLFWFAWTTYTSVPWIVPILASGLWGWSFYTLILMTYNYTEDSYGVYSASALAGLGLIRNLFGGGFPLFGSPMYRNEGNQWATSILAFLAVVLVPIPFILAKYGPLLRRRSPWAHTHEMETDSEDESRDGGGHVDKESG